MASIKGMGSEANLKCLIVGDIHGIYKPFRADLERLNPDIVLATGDFGYFPRIKPFITEWKNNNIPIYFCEGNHDDIETLNQLNIHEVAENIFYKKRGETINLPDGRTVLFIGGAQSIDKYARTEGCDYFPQEILTAGDYYRLDTSLKVDIVVSHTKPNYFDVRIPKIVQDPSEDVLDGVFDLYKPKQWFFSHWHKNALGTYKDCEWTLLNYYNNPGWYRWL